MPAEWPATHKAMGRVTVIATKPDLKSAGQNETSLRAKVGPVLITGCSSGLGEATARIFHKSGYVTIATARNVGDLASLAVNRRGVPVPISAIKPLFHLDSEGSMLGA